MSRSLPHYTIRWEKSREMNQSETKQLNASYFWPMAVIPLDPYCSVLHILSRWCIFWGWWPMHTTNIIHHCHHFIPDDNQNVSPCSVFMVKMGLIFLCSPEVWGMGSGEVRVTAKTIKKNVPIPFMYGVRCRRQWLAQRKENTCTLSAKLKSIQTLDQWARRPSGWNECSTLGVLYWVRIGSNAACRNTRSSKDWPAKIGQGSRGHWH